MPVLLKVSQCMCHGLYTGPSLSKYSLPETHGTLDIPQAGDRDQGGRGNGVGTGRQMCWSVETTILPRRHEEVRWLKLID